MAEKAYVDMSDFILEQDKRQASADGKVCPMNADHGKLGVHGSGTALMCAARGCDHHEGIVRES